VPLSEHIANRNFPASCPQRLFLLFLSGFSEKATNSSQAYLDDLNLGHSSDELNTDHMAKLRAFYNSAVFRCEHDIGFVQLILRGLGLCFRA
jgi:hypothetical protein